MATLQLRNKLKNIENDWEMAEIWSKQYFMHISAISQSFFMILSSFQSCRFGMGIPVTFPREHLHPDIHEAKHLKEEKDLKGPDGIHRCSRTEYLALYCLYTAPGTTRNLLNKLFQYIQYIYIAPYLLGCTSVSLTSDWGEPHLLHHTSLCTVLTWNWPSGLSQCEWLIADVR